MFRLALPLLLAVALVGCDAAAPADAALSAEASASTCTASISGPGGSLPGAKRKFTASLNGAGCTPGNVWWSANNGATVVDEDGMTAEVQAGTQGYTVSVSIVYNVDEIATASKSVDLP